MAEAQRQIAELAERRAALAHVETVLVDAPAAIDTHRRRPRTLVAMAASIVLTVGITGAMAWNARGGFGAQSVEPATVAAAAQLIESKLRMSYELKSAPVALETQASAVPVAAVQVAAPVE